MQTVDAHGAKIPVLGFGTWPMRGDECRNAVVAGLKLGYRHVDTAQGYSNEEEVGEGIRESGVPREDIFITTKVRPEWQSADRLGASLEESLRKLGVDVVDLTLIHWPNPAIPVAEAMKALSEAKRRGLTRHIGVSNFTVALLDQAVAAASEPLVTDQIEYHPFLDQTKMFAAMRRHGMAITAYCPVARGEVIGEPMIEAIAKTHGKTAGQVTLRWLIQQPDVIAIPKASRRERLEENLAIFDFTLSGAEMAAISALKSRGLRLVNEPAWVPAWD
jgi:diketogulonate reductase-like aldo/keto reductase